MIDVVIFGGFWRAEVSIISTTILQQTNLDSDFVTGNLITIHAENMINKQTNKQTKKHVKRFSIPLVIFYFFATTTSTTQVHKQCFVIRFVNQISYFNSHESLYSSHFNVGKTAQISLPAIKKFHKKINDRCGH